MLVMIMNIEENQGFQFSSYCISADSVFFDTYALIMDMAVSALLDLEESLVPLSGIFIMVSLEYSFSTIVSPTV